MKSKPKMKYLFVPLVCLGIILGGWVGTLNPCQTNVGEVRGTVRAYQLRFGDLPAAFQSRLGHMEAVESSLPWWNPRSMGQHRTEVCQFQEEIVENLNRRIRSETSALARASARAEKHRDWLRGVKKKVEQFRHERTLRYQYRQLSIRLGEIQRAIADGASQEAGRLLGLALQERHTLHFALRRTAKEYRRADSLTKWRAWIDGTLEGLGEEDHALIVGKYQRKIYLTDRKSVLEEYPVELGRRGLVAKRFEGDTATPEGRYRVVQKRDVGQTEYHRALLLDYPNGEDVARFERLKSEGVLPFDARIGDLIEIHGHGGKGRDWTDGCVALENDHLDALWSDVEVGTVVAIVGYAEPEEWL